jgi:hypothetical protein
LRFAIAHPLETSPKPHFIRAWPSIACFFPSLHTDGFEDSEGGWPRVLRRFPAEAWRPADAGDLNDHEVYPSDTQWSNLCDQMNRRTPHGSHREHELADLSMNCARA